VISKLRRGVYTPHGFSSFFGHQGLRVNLPSITPETPSSGRAAYLALTPEGLEKAAEI
jgi:hypothetical protein